MFLIIKSIPWHPPPQQYIEDECIEKKNIRKT
jgi:hypothetical protein